MNVVPHASRPPAGPSDPRAQPLLNLIDLIDLKWLMAHEGHRLHVERLQADPAYLCQCLALAEASPNRALQAAAARLRERPLAAG